MGLFDFLRRLRPLPYSAMSEQKNQLSKSLIVEKLKEIITLTKVLVKLLKKYHLEENVRYEYGNLNFKGIQMLQLLEESIRKERTTWTHNLAVPRQLLIGFYAWLETDQGKKILLPLPSDAQNQMIVLAKDISERVEKVWGLMQKHPITEYIRVAQW